MTAKVKGYEGITHWYLQRDDGHRIDLTANQFDNRDDIGYNEAKSRFFLQTGCTGPSKRARLLASLMGHDESDWKSESNNSLYL